MQTSQLFTMRRQSLAWSHYSPFRGSPCHIETICMPGKYYRLLVTHLNMIIINDKQAEVRQNTHKMKKYNSNEIKCLSGLSISVLCFLFKNIPAKTLFCRQTAHFSQLRYECKLLVFTFSSLGNVNRSLEEIGVQMTGVLKKKAITLASFGSVSAIIARRHIRG